MSFLEMVGSILTELEKVQEKLDRLLASGGEKELVEAETRMEPASNFKGSTRSNSKLPEVRIHSPGFEDYKPEPKKENIPATTTSNFALPKTGKYQWYRLKNNDKVKLRRCSNEGCPMFLKFNEDKKKYEHWKYDANTGVGGYVQDTCEYYEVSG